MIGITTGSGGRGASVLAAAGLLLAAAPASATVTPAYGRLEELKAVLSAEAVAALSANDLVERVERLGPGHWRLSTDRCRLDVMVTAMPPPRPGTVPPRFVVRAGPKVCD